MTCSSCRLRGQQADAAANVPAERAARRPQQPVLAGAAGRRLACRRCPDRSSWKAQDRVPIFRWRELGVGAALHLACPCLRGLQRRAWQSPRPRSRSRAMPSMMIDGRLDLSGGKRARNHPHCRSSSRPVRRWSFAAEELFIMSRSAAASRRSASSLTSARRQHRARLSLAISPRLALLRQGTSSAPLSWLVRVSFSSRIWRSFPSIAVRVCAIRDGAIHR